MKTGEGAVLDASALLAVLLGEPGAAHVERYLPDAVISAVNLSEVAGKLMEKDAPAEAVRQAIAAVGLEVIAFDEAQAMVAADLRVRSRALGLSLGDRACIALGETRGASVVTCDRVWSELDSPAEIVVARPD
ncbi:MAG: type II toxin-antitoxin system VapC family toxin [Oceanicaulis sp.]|uniref:type II toxin-antitoxin system VapC family toxin n=1 Tax=Glycocaulis sp. TaxID=1969725 RepID=UPI0025BC3675|nr:type II toxin-antitoxin system VapC family toxin [Glycocaulis sp.]MCC5980234.1 type II toxin-antitoxin system VapC family toxin [Oceanicaulis sp.]MCH8522583.1 type II toxin-antitoxin system VapC family toxin [Glycocaulis sp.]